MNEPEQKEPQDETIESQTEPLVIRMANIAERRDFESEAAYRQFEGAVDTRPPDPITE